MKILNLEIFGCTVVSSALELVKCTSNSNFHKKSHTVEGFSSPVVFVLRCKAFFFFFFFFFAVLNMSSHALMVLR